jgi:hypothetical protein
MTTKDDGDSDRFRPSTENPIVAITKRTDKIPQGYVCTICGHLALDECEIIGLICPRCLQKYLAENNVPQMVPIKDLKDETDSALVPTIKVDKPDNEATTKIMNLNPEEIEELKNTRRMIDNSTVTIKKTKGIMDSDFNIPGLPAE